MSDEENSEEKLLRTQKKERKELQAKIQSMKHSVPKGDKKKKKEITTEIAKLESELSSKHGAELADLRKNLGEVNNIEEQLEKMTTTETEIECSSQAKMSKVTRAQKRRDRKANKDKEREQLIAQQELENLKGARNLEAEKLKTLLEERQLTIFEVPSDGNCLYKAIEHQLLLQNISTTVEELRKKTGEYMLSHCDDFIPFLTNQTTGDIMTIDEFEHYCDDVINTLAWGGQVELSAISQTYQVPIEVIQADGPSLTIGSDYEKDCLILTYHRHIYGLGEHYNSTIQKSAVPDESYTES